MDAFPYDFKGLSFKRGVPFTGIWYIPALISRIGNDQIL